MIYAAVENEARRVLLTEALRLTGFEITVLPNTYSLRQIPLLCSDDLVLLETNDDVARLVQAVYELYSANHPRWTLPIIGLASAEAVSRNPSLGMWDINGHAAVLFIKAIENSDWTGGIVEFARALAASTNELPPSTHDSH